MKLPIDEYSASLGLPMTPKIRFLNQKIKSKGVSTKQILAEPENPKKDNALEVSRKKLATSDSKDEEADDDILLATDTLNEGEGKASEIGDVMYVSIYMFSGVQIQKFRLLFDNAILVALYTERG